MKHNNEKDVNKNYVERIAMDYGYECVADAERDAQQKPSGLVVITAVAWVSFLVGMAIKLF